MRVCLVGCVVCLKCFYCPQITHKHLGIEAGQECRQQCPVEVVVEEGTGYRPCSSSAPP